MPALGRLVLVSSLVFGALAYHGPARAEGPVRAEGAPRSQSTPRTEAGATLVDLEAQVTALVARPVPLEPALREAHVEETLARAELSLRLRDYDAAALTLTMLVDAYPEHRARADALSLLGEALYRARDDRGASARFAELLAHADEVAYQPYVDLALERLIDIAIRARRFEDVEGYLEARARSADESAAAAIAYQRGRYLYHSSIDPQTGHRTGAPALPRVTNEPGLAAALASLVEVPEGSVFYARARYLVGVIEALGGNLTPAVEALRASLRAEAKTPADRQVRALARISLARVRYEAGELRDALETYASISPSSPRYASALYESAWVHARRNAYDDAERALDAFLAVAPEDPRAVDAELFRGQLMTRAERYEEADALFARLREQLEPLRLEVEALPSAVPDLRAYVAPRVRQKLDDITGLALIPASVRPLVAPYAGLEKARHTLGALAAARRDVRAVEALLSRLRVVVEASHPITAFADLRHERQRLELLVNRVTALRSELVNAAQASRGGEAHRERLALEPLVAALPGEGASRDTALYEGYEALRAELPALRAALVELEARLAGAEHAVARDRAEAAEPASLLELRAAIAAFHDRLEALKRALEAGRMAIGPGDERSSDDARLRARYAALVAAERAGSPEDPALRRLAALDEALEARRVALDEATAGRVARLAALVSEETGKLSGYVETLARLTDEATEVGTDLVVLGYQLARQRLYDLSLRADLGHVDVGWSRHRHGEQAIETLTRQRAREVGGVDRLRRSLFDLPEAAER